MKNVWTVPKSRRHARVSASVAQLIQTVQQEWANIPSDRVYVSTLFGSMLHRLHMVVEGGGGVAKESEEASQSCS